MSAFPGLGARQAPHDPAALARAILAQSRFRDALATPQRQTWWDALRQWIGDRWSQLVEALSHHIRVSPGAGVAIGDVVLVGTVLLVIVVAVRLLLTIARESRTGPAGRSSPLAEHADARALFAAALEAAAQEAYASALALLFRAALANFDARGVLRDDPARTVNECRADVRRHAPRLGASFDLIARAFTAAVYAQDRVTAGDWLQARSAYEALGAHRDAA